MVLVPHKRWMVAGVSCIPWAFIALSLVPCIDKGERRKALQTPVPWNRYPRKDKSWFTGISPRGYRKACTSDSHELFFNECVSQPSASAVTANEGTSETRLFSHCRTVLSCAAMHTNIWLSTRDYASQGINTSADKQPVLARESYISLDMYVSLAQRRYFQGTPFRNACSIVATLQLEDSADWSVLIISKDGTRDSLKLHFWHSW